MFDPFVAQWMEHNYSMSSLKLGQAWSESRSLGHFNPLPNNNFLDWSKAFADNKINVTKKLKFVLEGKKTLWEKKEMQVTCIFFFSHNVFKRRFPPVRQKAPLCGNGLILVELIFLKVG